jgi:hypothetical protein
MARVAYTDLLVDFIIGTDPSVVTVTNSALLITNIYKQVYSAVNIPYSADDSTDTKSIVTSEEMFAWIQSHCTELVDAWHLSGPDNYIKPSFLLSNQDKKDIGKIMFGIIARTDGLLQTTLLYNEEEDHVMIR